MNKLEHLAMPDAPDANEKPQAISIGKYWFDTGSVVILGPYTVTKETEKCFFTNAGYRFLKEKLGTARIKSPNRYCRLEVAMLNGTDEELRAALAKWFAKTAERIADGERYA